MSIFSAHWFNGQRSIVWGLSTFGVYRPWKSIRSEIHTHFWGYGGGSWTGSRVFGTMTFGSDFGVFGVFGTFRVWNPYPKSGSTSFWVHWVLGFWVWSSDPRSEGSGFWGPGTLVQGLKADWAGLWGGTLGSGLRADWAVDPGWGLGTFGPGSQADWAMVWGSGTWTLVQPQAGWASKPLWLFIDFRFSLWKIENLWYFGSLDPKYGKDFTKSFLSLF